MRCDGTEEEGYYRGAKTVAASRRPQVPSTSHIYRYFFGGVFTVFHCDIALNVHLYMEAAPFFLIAIVQRRDPQGAEAGNRTKDVSNGRQAR